LFLFFVFGIANMPIGNLVDLSRLSGMPSLPTLRKIISKHPDFPFLARGKRGRGHKIDLDAAAQFIRTLDVPAPINAELRRAAIEELGLAFIRADIEVGS
jgi:hypothetical protein